MSNNRQLHAMTSVYSKLTMKLRTPTLEAAILASGKQQTVADMFQQLVGISDYKEAPEVNNVDVSKWAIVNLPAQTNYLPQGTIYRHISFIPQDIPDFRKVLVFNSSNVDPTVTELKSAEVKMQSTMKPPEITARFTQVTGLPKIPPNQIIPSLETISAGIIGFLQEPSSAGRPGISKNDMKLVLEKKIQDFEGLNQPTKTSILAAVDDAFSKVSNDGMLNGAKISLSQPKAIETFNYLMSNIITRTS